MKTVSHSRSLFPIVVIGGSAGAIEALSVFLAAMPKTLEAAILVAIHVGAESRLAEILRRHSRLPVSVARHGEEIEAGRVYVAPSDLHLKVEGRSLSVTRGPLENLHRPAIDPLFRSAARFFGDHVIGILFSGMLDDGSSGLYLVKRRGGIVIVQDPKEAVQPSMPRNALRHTKADYCLTAEEIGNLVPILVQKMAKRRGKKAAEREGVITKGREGKQVPVSCPLCHGSIFAVGKGPVKAFHCDIGHAFTPDSLDEAHRDALERALWVAIRTLRERSVVQKAVGVSNNSEKLQSVARDAAEDVARLEDILEKL